jgi:hypothetical protein
MESANSASAAALKLPTSVRPRRGLQFGLLTLLCVVTVLGCVLGKWFYYRPLTVMVDARLTFVDRDAASAIIAKHELHGVHDSPYSWLILADDEPAEAYAQRDPTLDKGLEILRERIKTAADGKSPESR